MKIFLSLLLLFSFSKLQAQSLKPLPSFGSNGKLTVNLGMDGSFYSYCVLPQPDGKMLLGGDGLVRLNANAEPDNSFALNGYLSTLEFGYVEKLALQADGKIILGIHSQGNILLQRVTAAGIADSSFGNNGKTLITEGDGTMNLNRIRVQADGKIVLLASYQQFTPEFRDYIFVARLNADGSRDMNFNGTGSSLPEVAPAAFCHDIALQSDGKMIITGSAAHTFTTKLIVFRLNANGTRDMGFNGNGLAEYVSPGLNSHEKGMLLHVYANNNILVAGRSGDNLSLLRLLPNGGRDNTFNGNGLVITSHGGETLPEQLDVMSNQKILITGSISYGNADTYNFIALRFNGTGVSDATFNGTGLSILSSPDTDMARGSRMNTDGSINIFGQSGIISLPNAARINVNGTFDLNYGTNGLKTILIKPTDEEVQKIFKNSDGKIVTVSFGSGGELNRAALVLSRFNADGSPDMTYGVNGRVYYDDYNFFLERALQQTDGKIIIAGTTYNNSSSLFETYLFRFNANGTADAGFGTMGKSLITTTDVYTTSLEIALAADGKITVVSFSGSDDDNKYHIYRLLTNGGRDNGFAPGGTKDVAVSFTDSYLEQLALQEDGKILIAGSFYIGNNSNYFCMRLTQSAEIDNSFAGAGIFINPATTSIYSESAGLHITKDQKILLTGFSVNDAGDSIYTHVTRILSNGTADPTFNNTSGTGTYFQASDNYRAAYPMAVALHPDSSLYITGNMAIMPEEIVTNSFIIRIKKDGSIDSSLSVNGDGWNLFAANAYPAYDADIFIAADSTILIGGSAFVFYENHDLFMAAFKRLPSSQGRVYTFTGNGNWNNAANWRNNAMPPHPLPDGSVIVIDPAANGTSIINVPQTIAPGGSFNIRDGGKVIIQGNLNISN